MQQDQRYPIGQPGRKWGAAEKAAWLDLQEIKRSYSDEVLGTIAGLRDRFHVEEYGQLEYAAGCYPLLAVKGREWRADNPVVLVTGGVHGYETSGVQGALRFLETRAQDYAADFNLLVAPCVSPWGYETINRWNPQAVDPNRSFRADSPAAESALLMQYLAPFLASVTAHIDLHETTDTDNSEFRPALAARDATTHDNWDIPDGFYLVGDTEHPAEAFQRAIIESVERVTHIAPADGEGRLIGVPLAQRGVINYETRALGLCAGMTEARYCTTTEVYPDSPRVDPENCIEAQVAAVVGALEYLRGLRPVQE